jgi:hypothetical protein
MAAFHLFVHKPLSAVASGAPEPLGAKVSGLLSLGLWIGVVACGRIIGFTTLG